MDRQLAPVVQHEHDDFQQPPGGVEPESQLAEWLHIVNPVGHHEVASGLPDVLIVDPVLASRTMNLHASIVIRN